MVKKIPTTIKLFCGMLLWIIFHIPVFSQSNFVAFNTIPNSGTNLIYAHHDDDLIWMLPFWNITEKFISGAMPSTPDYETIIHQQQVFLNNNGYNINYESNWITPWGGITQAEYEQYYWGNYPSLSYLADDHLISKWNNSDNILVRKEINRIKAKLEQYIAKPDVARIITHNNWGEYGHQHHKALNVAVRELAVKYRKDVWMSEFFLYENVPSGIPSDITYTSASFDTTLYTGIRSIYQANGCWTWDPTVVPSREYMIIKIVEGGVDKSDILTGQTVTTSGPSQNAPGAYIFDGVDDYMTLPGNNSPSFTIAMWVRPDQIMSMDISKMAEYPSSTIFDRSFYMQSDGRITAHVFNGGSKSVTSISTLNSGEWTNVLMSGDGNSMKLYINGVLDGSVITGSTFTFFNSPEFVLGQTQETTNFFNGQIKDVQFFDYVLSDEEIASLAGTSSQESYVIAANSGFGGTINPSGTRIVLKGAALTYNITPDTGYIIDDVKVDNNSVGPVATYVFNNITSNHTISATFTPITFTIMSDAGLNGSISPDGDIATSYGTSRTFSIIPDQGYQISDVEVDNISVGAVSTYTFENVLANHTIAASFEIAKYTINGSAGPNGSITPSGIITLEHGTNQTYRISGNTGFMISDVRVDDISVGAVSLYTFNNVSDNHTISATFEDITYTITGSSGPNGTITPGGAVTVNYGSNMTYTITPNTGYNISNVRIDNVSVGIISSYMFNNVTADHTISATFTPITFTITSDAGLNGSISPDGDITTSYGTSRTFSIIPDQGYQISDVEVNNISVGAVSTYTFENVLANHTIAASFEIAKYTINGSAGPNGSITPSGIITLEHGTNQTYRISGNTGFMISDVRVDDISVGAVSLYTFNNVSDNHTITATFEDITYTITGSSGPNGTITPGGAVTVNYGSNMTYTITPNTGYNISNVRIDNVSVGIVSSYMFSNVTADHTISATFSPISYTITNSSGSGGSINPSGIITVDYGTGWTYSITPNVGYHISDVRVDNNSVGAVSSYIFSNITANHTISATFAINTYTIAGSSGKYGSITPAGITTLDFGTNRVYTITPDPGFQISDVLVDNNSMGALSTYSFNSVSANHTISAIFSIITYKITASAGTNGSITPTGEVILDRGMSGTYTITPATGFRLSDLKVDNVSVDPVLTYTFNNVTSDHTISATFSLITYTITGNVVKGAGEGEGGSISPSGQIKVNYGSNQTCTITPATGYDISDVIVDNISMGVLSTYTFGNITTDHTISAIFKPIIYIIKSNAGSGGSISTQGTETVIYGTDQTYTITPDAGYQISEVLVDGTSVGTPLSYIFNSITTNHTITATFIRIVYLITESADAGGSISPAATLALYYGENQTYTIIPESTYKISDVKVDNISQGPLTSYTFKNITASHTISASFKLIDTYLITANAGPGGTISHSGPNKFPEGTNQTYTITPDIGYRITGVQVDNITEGILSDYTFTNLMSDHNISATFTMDIEVKIYPNPFKDYFKINILSPSDFLFNISIINITGEVVFTRTKIPGNAETEINLRNTPAGIYFLRLYSLKNRMVYRIVKY